MPLSLCAASLPVCRHCDFLPASGPTRAMFSLVPIGFDGEVPRFADMPRRLRVAQTALLCFSFSFALLFLASFPCNGEAPRHADIPTRFRL